MRPNQRTWLPVVAAIIVTAVLVTVAATLVNQLAFGPTQAHSDNDAAALQLRISAKPLTDGRIELALQQRDSQGWGQRLAPRARFLPVDAQLDRWINSSPITFAAPRPLTPARPIICVIADGDPDAHFWRLLEFHTLRAGDLLGLHVRYSSNPNLDDRIATINQCVDDDVPMILATLADAGGVIPALHDAAARGVKIATFGAGEDHADRAGSLIHVSFNESAAGLRAIEQFDAHNVRGPLLCIGKQGNPQGRNGICDLLDQRYQHGAVTTHLFTTDNRTAQIATLLDDQPDIAGILVVEADLLPDAIAAIQRADAQPVLGAIGEYPLSQLSFPQRDRIAFTVMDLARVESLLPMSALYYMYRHHPNARFFSGAMQFNGTPNVHIGGPSGGHGRPPSQNATHDDDQDH